MKEKSDRETGPEFSLDQWLDTAVRGIRFGPDRRAVRAELYGHLEDKIADLRRIFPDLTDQEAQERALAGMGDAAEIGKQLARVHRPWLGYLWRVSQVLLALCLVWYLGFNISLGDDGWPGGDDSDFEWWDFDGLPYDAGLIDWYREIYLPGDDPDQLLTLSPDLTTRIGGQNVSLLRGALWEEDGGARVLYLHLRVDSWKFWELGELEGDWLTITDDRGNTYGLGLEGPKTELGGLLSSLSGRGYGPFHHCYVLKLWGIDPEAERLRLDYGPVGSLFSFTVDFEEGAA